MNKAILFLLVLAAACGGTPESAHKLAEMPNEHVSVFGSDAGTATSIDYLDGRDGKDGRDGMPGVPGTPGAQGLQGPQGPEGVAGPQGLTGAQGLQGSQGADGAGGYWVDSTGARAPIVNGGGANVNNTMYVTPQGFMYKVHPLTGHLETSRAEPRGIIRYFEEGGCTGRSWYQFEEGDFVAPMVTFTLRGVTHAFSRDVKVAYAEGQKVAGFPRKPGSQISYAGGVAYPCYTDEFTWPALAVTRGDDTKHYYYYVDAVYVVAAPDPETLIKATVPPYRFVPNL